ncbi:MAG: phospho-sugar mutase [Rhabdochlamydiaceae bacterium]|nr:phospho-sugar mutase [Candidatus Amphrikana amoebophyrae]
MSKRNINEIVKSWLDGPYDNETKNEILSLQKEDPSALEDAFYKDLSFGTGGMRGIMGVGTNRMNIYTIGKATQGLANYINEHLKTNDHPSCVICYDSRHHSHEFATWCARVLAGNGIEVWISKELRPTPFTSFMMRKKEAVAGIMLTASHNTKEYNGYKVYGPDGAQVVAPHDKGIVDAFYNIKSMDDVNVASADSQLIKELTTEDDDLFIKAIAKLQIHPQEANDFGDQIKIIYSSLHGCGITLIPQAFESWGLTNYEFVKKQVIADGDFPTVIKPNPEDLEALSMGTKQMIKNHGDIFIANDPDADRVGVVCMHEGKPYPLTGNEIAAICFYHIVNTMQQKETLTRNHACVSTIVTTRLLKKIANDFKVHYYDVLTGFKYIGEKIHQFEQEENPHQFLFGAEESYGYLIGTHSRDKDAIVASCMIAQIALHLKLKGLTLVDLLHDIYQLYFIHKEAQKVIALEDSPEGLKKKEHIMQALRDPNLTKLDDESIVRIEDYQSGKWHNLITNESGKLDLPKSDVLVFELEDESRFIIRPSGTEPKVKIYGMMIFRSFLTVPKGIKEVEKMLQERLDAIHKKLIS